MFKDAAAHTCPILLFLRLTLAFLYNLNVIYRLKLVAGKTIQYMFGIFDMNECSCHFLYFLKVFDRAHDLQLIQRKKVYCLTLFLNSICVLNSVWLYNQNRFTDFRVKKKVHFCFGIRLERRALKNL